MTQIVPDSTTTFHQLNLFLINLHDGTVTIGITIKSYHEAITEGSHLMFVANACHRTSCWDNVPEMVQ